MMNVGLFSLLLIFELIQQAAVVNFILLLNILKILKTRFEHFKGNLAYPWTSEIFFPENLVKLFE